MNLIDSMDAAGTLVFAMSGALTAMERRMDLFGVSVIAFVTALGGGTLRDVLIGSLPVGWAAHPHALRSVALGIAVAVLFKPYVMRLSKTIFLFDTLGIGLFSLLGLQKTLALGLPPEVAVIMGAVSAVFGGVLRDLLCGRVPLIFRKEIYATVCLAGGACFLLLERLWPQSPWNMAAVIALIVAARILIVKYGWSFPQFK
jgi:uncharacterized membrane protein YeiH